MRLASISPKGLIGRRRKHLTGRLTPKPNHPLVQGFSPPAYVHIMSWKPIKGGTSTGGRNPDRSMEQGLRMAFRKGTEGSLSIVSVFPPFIYLNHSGFPLPTIRATLWGIKSQPHKTALLPYSKNKRFFTLNAANLLVFHLAPPT